eukprot:XP_011683927.1 PREDICTED: synaptotagmin-7 isoform X1 [Strongylocentrotus purpuratus]
MYVPEGGRVEGGEQEVIHQVVTLLTSTASLVVLVLATFFCGMCYCFGGSKPDYDDDEGTTGFRNSDQEQKWPILNRSASLGERGAKNGGRNQSPVFVHQSSLRPRSESDESVAANNDESIATGYGTMGDSSIATRTTVDRAHVEVVDSFAQTSFEFEKRSQVGDKSATLPPELSNKRSETPKKSVMFRSQSVDPSLIPSERLKPNVGVEHIQPDPSKLAQSQLGNGNGQAEAIGIAQGLDDDSMQFGEELGKIQFSLMYDFPDQTLVLRIVKANHLPAKDFSGTSDPFVKIMLLPDKKVKMETKVKRKNLNPIWNESFHFEGYPYSKIQERVLHLQVLDYDRFSRNDPIGEINLPLAEIDLTHEKLYWRSLTPSKKSSGKLGSLLISLCYAPTAGRITITVLKCQNLAAKDITGKSDPYVKIWHMHKDKRVEKKKTVIKYHTLNPVYNESFVFNIPLDRIRDTTFVVSVLDKDRLSKNDMIGGILLGARTSPAEMSHWNEMMSKPRTNIAKWHVLKGVN